MRLRQPGTHFFIMKRILIGLLVLSTLTSAAQNDRVSDFNQINWLQTLHTIPLGKKWSIHAEYQWRREQGLKNWQQSLLRLGANYNINEQVTAHLGYGWIETFPYGDFPLASAGTFPEHRIYEQLVLRQPVSKWSLIHRFRVEQRWVGKRDPVTPGKIAGWSFLHRFRYQFRAQVPLWVRQEKRLYAAGADEIFIGAGKNLGSNIFDQNRIFLLLGYRFSKKVSVEGGYMNQTIQQGKRINGNTIMQRNNGIVLTSYFNW